MSGYEGEGTGGGWGEWAGADAPGSGWAGKPGESAMAQAQSQQNLSPLTERADTRDQEGWYDGNTSLTVGQLERNQSLNDALTTAAPIATSFVPGFGTMMGFGRAGAKFANGAPITDVMADVLPGFINGKINQATGGLYGTVSKYGGILNTLTDGETPKVPNVGREIVSGIIGRPSGGTYTAQPGTSRPSEGNGDTTMASRPPRRPRHHPPRSRKT
jgi:hypothetical protein